MFKHIEVETKWLIFCIWDFQMGFLEYSGMNFDFTTSLEFVPKDSINNTNIGSVNGFAPNRRQAMIWTHDDLAY